MTCHPPPNIVPLHPLPPHPTAKHASIPQRSLALLNNLLLLVKALAQQPVLPLESQVGVALGLQLAAVAGGMGPGEVEGMLGGQQAKQAPSHFS